MDQKNVKVIIIDDENMVAEMLKDYLEDSGFSVSIAGTGEEGLEMIASENFDVAIVDMRLPDMIGNDFIRKAYIIKPEIRYFVHTGSLNYRLPDELIALGMDRNSILYKPVSDMSKITDAISELTEK